MPTPSRAAFIMVNIARMPLWGWPTSQPFAASKFITHWKRLSEKSDNSIALMETRLEALGPKVGPVLFQLPPRFTANLERLALPQVEDVVAAAKAVCYRN